MPPNILPMDVLLLLGLLNMLLFLLPEFMLNKLLLLLLDRLFALVAKMLFLEVLLFSK